jgi:esterase/lipase superfamily enzyme
VLAEGEVEASTFPPMLAANCSTALGRAVPHALKRARAFRVLGAAALLAGCAGSARLMPTPRIYTGAGARPLFTGPPPPTTSLDLLYVTDRVPVTTPDGSLAYSSDRSRSMAFGSVTVDIGEQVSWPVLAQQSTESKRELPLELRLGAVTELGRFPPIPYDVDPMPGGITRSSATVEVHQRAAAGLQAEVARRIKAAPRKEVVLFVHGFANTFEDAAFKMADLCHFFGREFVCGIFSWPAGGTRGMMAGYNVDRESGEFAVQHLKQAIRLIAQTPGVERIHLMAHSRGTDVLASALRELNIEAYIAGDSVADRFKLKNIVLLAPDMDADVAAAKIFGVVSDPDLVYGAAPQPRKVFSGPGVHITAYVSPSDKALTLSQFLFGSLVRLGRIDVAGLRTDQAAKAVRLAYLVDFIEVKRTRDFLGHSYFTSDPAVSSDVVALIRYGLKPGEPGRPLEEIRRPFWRIPAGT